jgi:hypothetical protein
MDAPTVRAIAEREVLVAEPTLREAFVRVVLTRPAKRIACVVVILFLLVDVFPP